MSIGRRAQFLSMLASPQGCFSVFMAWQLASPKKIIQETKEEVTIYFMIYTWKSRIIILLVLYWGQPWFVVQSDYT